MVCLRHRLPDISVALYQHLLRLAYTFFQLIINTSFCIPSSRSSQRAPSISVPTKTSFHNPSQETMWRDPTLLDATALAQIPAGLPPFGVIPDFNGPNPLSYIITGVASTSVGLTLFFLGIRMYTKTTILRRWTWDDGAFHQLSLQTFGLLANDNPVTCGIGLVSTVWSVS